MKRLLGLLLALCIPALAQVNPGVGAPTTLSPAIATHPIWLPNVNSAWYAGQLSYSGITNAVQKAPSKSFSQSWVDASIYGFATSDTTGTTNFAAFATMATAVNASGGYTAVRFAPGVYKIDASTITAYHSTGSTFTNLRNFIIDASQATFLMVNDAGPRAWLMRFDGCTNMIFRMNWKGTNHTDGTNGVGGVWLRGNNSSVDYAFTSNKMYEGVRVGENEDPYYQPSAAYEGNHDINIWSKCVDTYYACPVYLASNVNIWCESIGTSAGGYGAYRAVYIEACNNVHAVSRTKDLVVPDGVNIISMGPRYTSPQMVGCTNVWLDATDLGTTHITTYQNLVKVCVVTCHDAAVQNLSATMDNIHINITLSSSATLWGSNLMVVFQCLGTGSNVYSNIFLSGRVKRLDGNNRWMCALDGATTGLSTLGLTAINLHDDATGRFFEALAANQPVAIHKYLSDVGTCYFTTPAVQTITAH